MEFDEGELEHGQRYMVCIHSEYTEIIYEKWTQVLPEINECSDGIVVDLTPPVAGKVWIGNKQGVEYQVKLSQGILKINSYAIQLFMRHVISFLFLVFQTSTSVLYINWNTFQDVEEFQTISHASGIQNYKLGIGI